MNLPAENIWTEEELEVIRPPEKMSISEWAERYRILPPDSAIKGPYQLAMVPFLLPVMDACRDTNIDEVVLCKPAQVGGTSCFLNVVGYYSDQDPSPIMIILADQSTAEYVSAKQVQPMFKSSEYLRRLYRPSEFTKTDINLANGGHVTITWASSVSELGTRAVRIVCFDEIDKPGYYITTKEADPLSLGRERTSTYPEGYFKHFLWSTPTIEEGNITKELYSCDIIYDWHARCPYCGQYQILRWSPDPEHTYGFKDGVFRADDGTMKRIGQVIWEGGRNATNKEIVNSARYECGECKGLWNTQQKNAAVRNGKCVPRTESTGYERKVGFHVNRIYSLFDGGKLEKLVQKWVGIFRLSGEKKRKALQGFINSTLAEPWKQVTITSTEQNLLKARCNLMPQTVPREAVALTAAIDVQKYNFWFTVRAWARDYTSWLIHYGQLATWSEVENLLFEAMYPVEDRDQGLGIRGQENQDSENQGSGEGGQKKEERRYMRIWRAGLDTGGGEGLTDISLTEEAYLWLQRNARGRGCRVWATKGSSRTLAGKLQIGRPITKTPSGKPIPGGLQIVLLDTEKCKDMVYYRLNQAIENGPHAAYLHSGTAEDYAMQILAEEKQRDAKGVEKWVQVSPNNHYLDCESICMIVADLEWPGGGVHLLRGALVHISKSRHEKKKQQRFDPRSWQQNGSFKRPSWLNR